MTQRIDKPDTAADVELRGRLAADGMRNFVMVAGAGSGKTTSLVKALDFIRQTQGRKLQDRQQRIACITYTEVATEEIWGDIGHDPLFHISTIHSFLWEVIRPFQHDIARWVARKIDRELDELAEARMSFSSRTRQTTRDKNAADVERYQRMQQKVKSVRSFRYLTGRSYEDGIVGHADVLPLVSELISQKVMLRRVFASRYPYVFVDESQDTDPMVVSALKAIAATVGDKFCLGFFGDPMQKIYMVGLGRIKLEEGWCEITKPENFRCPTSVLKVINRIRKKVDGLEQTRGRMRKRRRLRSASCRSCAVVRCSCGRQTNRPAQCSA